MPDKGRHGRGRHLPRSRRKRAGYATIAAERQQVVSQVAQPAARPRAVAAPAPASSTADAGVRYNYVMSELRRIGILGAVIIIILCVLAVFLS